MLWKGTYNGLSMGERVDNAQVRYQAIRRGSFVSGVIPSCLRSVRLPSYPYVEYIFVG